MSRLLYAASRLKDLSRLRHDTPDIPTATERLGQASHQRPEGRLLWLHAETPDEVGAAPALAYELGRALGDRFNTLVTTTVSGSLAPSVADQVIHQLVPGETSGSVSRFLEYWQPDVAVFLGLPDRPNLILAAAQNGCPLYLAASRRGTLAARRRLSLMSSEVLDCFQACLAASAADADVLHRHLGADRKVEVAGPLSDTVIAIPCNDAERDDIATALRGRPVWLAADISSDEVDTVEKAHARAFRFAHRLLLVVIPGDPAQGADMAERLESRGWKVARAMTDDLPSEADQVFVADAPDLHGLWYRLSPTTFVGGTLDPSARPSDPFAPAALGSAVLHGPHTSPAPVRFLRLAEARGCVQVEDSNSLGDAVQRLLAPDKAAELAQAGWQVTTEGAHAIERLTDLIGTAFDERMAK